MKKYEKEIEGLESKARECENGMKELKVLLYVMLLFIVSGKS